MSGTECNRCTQSVECNGSMRLSCMQMAADYLIQCHAYTFKRLKPIAAKSKQTYVRVRYNQIKRKLKNNRIN